MREHGAYFEVSAFQALSVTQTESVDEGQKKTFIMFTFFVESACGKARHSCYFFAKVYVRAYVRICPGHNSYIYGWISKLFDTLLSLRWMDDLRFYVLFDSISVISGRWADDNERLCAMEPRLRLRRFRLERVSNSGPLDQ